MTPAGIIALARFSLNDKTDTGASPRQDDAELLSYVNSGLREASTLAPLLFSTVAAVPCVAGQCEQALTFQDAVRLIDVLRVHGGPAMMPMDRAAMDAFKPGWRGDPQGVAVQWAPMDGDPLRFLIYPQAPVGQVLDVRYVRVPRVYALNETIEELPDVYLPALANYVIFAAERKDDENVLNQRAAASYTAFKAQFGGGAS